MPIPIVPVQPVDIPATLSAFGLLVTAMGGVITAVLSFLNTRAVREVAVQNKSIRQQVSEQNENINVLRREMVKVMKPEFGVISKEQLLAIAELSKETYMLISIDGIILSWNHGAEILFGYYATEIIGKPFTTLVSPEGEGQKPDTMEKIKSGYRLKAYDATARLKDGTDTLLAMIVIPLYAGEDKVAEILIVARKTD